MKFEELSSEQKRFIDCLLEQNSEENRKKSEEIVKEIGISESIYYEWKRDPEFIKIVYKETLNRLGLWLPKALMSLAKKADKGDIKAIKLFLEHFNIFKDDIKTTDKLTNDEKIVMIRNGKNPGGNSEDNKKLEECTKSPWYFMTNFVYTLDRKEGIKKFPDYPYLKDFVETMKKERLIVVLKSMQMMITWTVVAFLLWDCIFSGSSENLVISKREEEAKGLLHRLKFIYNNLPEFMNISIGYNNKNMIEFKGLKSRIISLPSSPDIGRSYSPNRIFWDEMAFTPNSDEVFQSLQPCLDGGGSFIGVSTPNGIHTKHASLCLNNEEEGFVRIDTHYSLHPEKDEKWLKEAKKGMSIDRWNQEQELSMKTAGRRVYERFSERNHIIDWNYSPDLPVYRTIDFGYHTPVVLWIQVTVEDTVIVFHEWIGENNTVSEMFEKIKAGDEEIGIDGDIVEITYCDPAGKAVTDKGISSVDYLEEKGISLNYRSSFIPAGIDLVRENLMDASGKISLKVSRNCKRIIKNFMQYSKCKNSEEPRKDNISDHTMDALRYFIVNYFDKSNENFKSFIPVRIVEIGNK